MRVFLEALAKHILEEQSQGMEELCVILPNRRSGVFLQHHLARHSPGVNWSPRIFSMSEYVQEISILGNANQVELLFGLYGLYKDLSGTEDSLDDFYHWGEMILRDFDELDKYLVEADGLFINLSDLKEIEDLTAGLDSEQLEFIRQFWKNFFEGGPSREKTQFTEMWKLLPRLYHGLRSRLIERGEGYQGMQYREIVERIRSTKMDVPAWDQVIIAGFNALNACEKEIFNWLNKHGASFFWDYDHEYLADRGSEAGRFMRDNLKQYPEKNKLEDFKSLSQKKDIGIFDLPSDIMQARNLNHLLSKDGGLPIRDCTDTAVVLCDEELLMPVLGSMPDDAGEVNITMGYPVKNSPLMSFLNAIVLLQQNRRTDVSGVSSFYYRDVRSVLLHPYLNTRDNDSKGGLLEKMTRENMIYLEEGLFADGLKSLIFRRIEGSNEWSDFLRKVFSHVLEYSEPLEREFIFRFLSELNNLESALAEMPEASDAVFTRLLLKMVRALRVPFEGEPLSGLQVMGILETRLLDFRRVIMLSVNEEVMPARQVRQSNIPYAFRMAFGMPSREDMEAIYAYYFYRLLQRTDRIDLMYNSSVEGTKTGEMSRYLQQLLYRRGCQVIRPGLEVQSTEKVPIIIEHNNEIDTILERYLKGSDQERFLSPSALNDYIDCSLRFYFRRIAGIGEADEVSEEIDHRDFGSVVHDCLRELYEEQALGNEGILDTVRLTSLLKPGIIKPALERKFREHHFKGRKNARIEGRNIIILKVMEGYVKQCIETDLRIAPFKLLSVEERYMRELELDVPARGNKNVMLGGVIDRIDRHGDRVRVIDYKTGKASVSFSSLEALFRRDASGRNRAALQTMLYAWLVEEKYSGEKIVPGIYSLRSLFREDFNPALKEGGEKKGVPVDDFSQYREEFLNMLMETLTKLFDPTVPFLQTEKEEICKYCDYSAICSRNTIE